MSITLILTDIKPYIKRWGDTEFSWGGGVSDHGALTGLADDDHTQYALADGSRGTFEVAGAVAAHAAASDPHTGYQKESEKGAVNGYASLDATTRVPMAQLASGTPDGTKFIRDDGTLQTPTGGTSDHGALTGLGDDDHTQYQLRSEENAASGYAGLDGAGRVAYAQLPTDIATDGDVSSALFAHESASDPHAQYQLESEKGAANGYASLDDVVLVPAAQLGAGVPSTATFLRGDSAWVSVTASPITPYAIGVLTIPTSNFVNYARRVILTGAQRVTAQGTACLRVN